MNVMVRFVVYSAEHNFYCLNGVFRVKVLPCPSGGHINSFILDKTNYKFEFSFSVMLPKTYR